METLINTEMYFFDGNDGFFYIHFPVRGYAVKTNHNNIDVLYKLKNKVPLDGVEEKAYWLLI
ncbi:hypothetical protein [Edwardsiella ictaluri]|uniref:hypothetical protein n=1 Tax=Edwardsiella ictaluri TaxID=67780 RepID=UPI0039F6B645